MVSAARFTRASPLRNMVGRAGRQPLGGMDVARNRIRLLALGTLAALLCACGSARAASPWGKLNHFSLPVGSEPGHVVLSNVSPTPKFAAGTDGSYYILDSPNEDEFRLQRFTGSKVEASISFSPPLTSPEKKGIEGAGREAVNMTLAVDPSRNRVYVLTHYERKTPSPKEEKEEETTEKPVFPLDSGVSAAGTLYAFEYASATKTLTSVAKRKNEKGEEEPGPVLSRTVLAAQGETPGEALLDPRGMAVDPSTGNLVVTGNQDQESNQKVREGAQKQCRPAVQFVAIEANSKGEIKAAKLGRRYVDRKAAILNANGQELGCGEREPEEAEEKAPLAPVFAPDGSLLVLYDNESEGTGQIWEMAPTQTTSQAQEEVEATPQQLFDTEAVESVLEVEPAAEQGDNMMSLISESTSDGTIYLDEEGRGGLEDYISGESAPLVLHYHRPSGGKPSLSEVGWTAGGRFSVHGGPEACTLRKPEQGSVELAGLGSGKYLGFTTYVEAEGPNNEIRVPRVELVEFGEGGSTSGCPLPALTTPVQSFAGQETHTLPASAEKITVSSYLNRIEGGVVKSPALANAKSVEWTIKFMGPAGENETKHLPPVEYPLGGAEDPLKLLFAFEHAGTYEITDVVHTDALAGEVVSPSSPDKVKVNGRELSVKIGLPKPLSVRAHEEEAEFTATVEDPTVAKGAQLTLASVTWQIGEEAPLVEGEQKLENGGTLKLKHALARCKTAKCKVAVTVKEAGAEGLIGHSEQTEITVTESRAEEAARIAAEEAARKAKEAQEAAQHTKEAQEAQQAKEAQEAAQHAKEAQEGAQHAKEAEEAARKAKEAEETRIGLLAYQVSAAPQSSISVNSSGALALKLSCPSGATCSGTLSLRTVKAVIAGKSKHKSILALATGSFSVSSGQTKSITLHLNASARALLAKSHSLAARLMLVANGPHGQEPQGPRNVILRLVASKKHGKH